MPLLQVWPTNNTQFAASLSPVIGRGGEQINKIQQESGCKVQIAPGTVSSSVALALTAIQSFQFFIIIDSFILLLVLAGLLM